MNYDDLKDEIKSIAEIANGVPEKFRERCFELLLQHLLDSFRRKSGEVKSKLNGEDVQSDDKDASKGKFERSGTIPTPSQVKVLLQKTGVTPAELAQILIYEDDEVHFVQEPTTQKSPAVR